MKKNILITILSVALIGTIGYITYDKFLNNSCISKDKVNVNDKAEKNTTNFENLNVNSTFVNDLVSRYDRFYKFGDAAVAGELYSKENLKASEKEINEAIEKIKEAYNALVRKDVLQFQEAIASIDKCNSKEEMYKAINNAIECFNSVEDKEMVTKEHEILIQKINEYNDYVDRANSNLFSLTSASHLAAAISLSTMISLLFVFIRRRISL